MRILTFDIEDWFHVLDNLETASEAEWARFPSRLEAGLSRILDLLDRHGQNATFFVLGWIAREYPDALVEIHRRGHEIGTHSDMHGLVYKMSQEAFESDLRRSIDAIAEVTGERPVCYRAPGFSITESCTWAFDILAENGIHTDCSVFPTMRGHGGLPSFPTGTPCLVETRKGNMLKSFPISFVRLGRARVIFSGGGYFRIVPAFALQQLFKGPEYIMTYFHPRDFDPDQPMIPGLSRVRRFKSYVGLKTALAKLEALIEQHDFISLDMADKSLDWGHLPKISV